MAAAATDLFQEVGTPGTATTLSSPGYTIGDVSVTVGSTSGWPTATGVTFAIDRAEVVNGVEVRVDGTYCEFVGTVASGTSVTNVSKVFGTAQNYAAGALTRVYIPVSSERENRIVEGILTEHNQDGTHDATKVAMLAGTQTFTGSKTFTNLTPPTGFVVQVVDSQTSAVSTGTTVIPLDDTIPQNIEGDQYLSVAITPKSTTNKLYIVVELYCTHTSAADLIAALFQDSTASALAAAAMFQSSANGRAKLTLSHEMAAGTTSATTFKVRAGGSVAGTLTVNGTAGARQFGGVTLSSIKVTEVKA